MVKAIGAVIVAAIWVGSASAANLSRCAAIDDNGRRLACYDKLAGRAAPAGPATQADRSSIRDEIIERCQRRMAAHGPAIVKGCVDMDMEAHTALADYPAKYRAIVDRCTRRMRSHGWAIVQGCTDMDIDAARALERMKKR